MQGHRTHKGLAEEEVMSMHDISDDIKNSDIEKCIDEYVRLIEHRAILRERWFEGASLEELAERHNKSLTVIKRIIYSTGDKILLKASKM